MSKTKTNKTKMFNFAGVELVFQLNKNGGVYDVQPRIGNLYYRIYGRPWLLKETRQIIKEECLMYKTTNNYAG